MSTRLALFAVFALAACREPAPASRHRDALWTSVAPLPAARHSHAASVLPNGKVLVCGGFDASNTHLKTALIYDPAANQWSPAASMATARTSHVATLLSNGKVLVTGGYGLAGNLASAELYDVATDTWSPAGSMSVPRTLHAAVQLNDNRVLVVGGAGALSSAERYDPATNGWTLTGAMISGRASFGAALLPNGKVLVAGGLATGGAIANAELYDPAVGAWSGTGPLAMPRYWAATSALPDGRVLVAGGFNGSTYQGSSEVYVPAAGTFSQTASMNVARHFHTAQAMPGARVLIAGSPGVLQTEVYDGTTHTWALGGPLATARVDHTVTLLSSGKVLIVGGQDAMALASVELFEDVVPDAGTPTDAGPPLGDGGMSLTLGMPCASSLDCASGHCSDNVCCDSACAGACDACDLPLLKGSCTPRPAGSAGQPSCAPVVCNGLASVCPQFCSVDSQCVASHFCSGSVCYPRGALGTPCANANRCISGFCVRVNATDPEGKCCDTACDAACDACNVVGRCVAVPAGSPGTPSCAPFVCNGSPACPTSCANDTQCVAADSFCSDAGTCFSRRDAGTSCFANNECLTGFCVAGLCCDTACTDACDACGQAGALGACTRKPPSARCPQRCTLDTDCPAAEFCSNLLCKARPAPGSACTQKSDCPGGNCTDGVCCDRACSGPCDACNLPGLVGTCTLLADGSEGTPACAPYLCSGAGPKCRGTCTEDAHCAKPNFCSGGFCTTNPRVPPSTPQKGCGCAASPASAFLLALLLLVRKRGKVACPPILP